MEVELERGLENREVAELSELKGTTLAMQLADDLAALSRIRSLRSPRKMHLARALSSQRFDHHSNGP